MMVYPLYGFLVDFGIPAKFPRHKNDRHFTIPSKNSCYVFFLVFFVSSTRSRKLPFGRAHSAVCCTTAVGPDGFINSLRDDTIKSFVTLWVCHMIIFLYFVFIRIKH